MKYIDKVYVCHHPPLVERSDYIDEELRKKRNLDFEYIQGYLPTVLDEYYKGDLCKITRAELSLYLKHVEIFQRSVVWEIPMTLILEDDVLIEKDFSDVVESCAKELIDKEGELCFVGVCCGLHLPKTSNDLIYTNGKNTTRCTHAYLITSEAASKILYSSLLYIHNKPIDHKLNDIILEQNIKNYWYEPGIPQNPMFESSLRKD